jgi:competence protein ComEC
MLAFSIGFGGLLLQVKNYQRQTAVQGETLVIGRVVEKVRSGYYFSITIDSVSFESERVKGKLVAYLPLSFEEKLCLGDRVIFRSEIENVGKNGSVYEIENGVCYYAESKNILAAEHTFDLFLFLRERMEKVVYSGMDETSASVSYAVLTGNTSGIDNGLLQNVRYGGIAHIFAVSGLHIGALFAFCLFFFTKTRLKMLPKILRFLLVASLLLFYGGICGFSSSVIRAIVMCLIGYAAALIVIGKDGLETLGFAAIVVLSISPISLFLVGFQLSFAACLGILLFARPMQTALDRLFCVQEDYLQRKVTTVKKRVVSTGLGVFCVSFAAQITTFPILINAFGYFSGWSFLLNFLFTPLIGAGFSFLLLFVAVSCFLPLGAIGAVLYIPSVLWSALLLTFELVDFSTFCLQGFTLSFGAIVCYYLGVLFCTDKWNMRALQKWSLACVCLVAFLSLAVLGAV